MKKMVLIHKTPASWNKKEHLPKPPDGNNKTSESEILNFDSELKSLLETDLYIAISRDLCEKLEIDELHIVQGFSPTEEKNWIDMYSNSNGSTFHVLVIGTRIDEAAVEAWDGPVQPKSEAQRVNYERRL